MKKRVFIVHGWEGHPEEGWFPWLKKELEKHGFEVIVPQMPNTDHPQLSEWLHALTRYVGKADENTFFVGHSLGCITILRYLESIEAKVGGAVLVAGFGSNLTYDDYRGELNSFFETPINWSRTKSNSLKFAVIQSDNDSWVPLPYGQFLSQQLDTKMILLSQMGHFSGSDGVTQLPIALESLLSISKNGKSSH